MSTWKHIRNVLAVASLAACGVNFAGHASAQDVLEKVKAAGELKIGWAEWRPLEYRDIASGELKGALIVLAEEVSKRMELKSSFVQDNWSTITAGIAADKFQVALMANSVARDRVVDFTQPIYRVPYSVIVKDSSGLKSFDEVNTPEHSISVTTGSTTDELLTELSQSGELKAQVVRLKDVGGALLSLTTGNTTAFATTVDALGQIVEQQTGLRLVEGSFGASPYAIAHAENNEPLNKALNEAIASMVEDGTVEKILKDHNVTGPVVGAQE